MRLGKWIGAGLGWAIGGPIGFLIGLGIGSLIDISNENTPKTQTTQGDFALSIILLSALVMRSDNKLLKSELNYIKSFLNRNFSPEHVKELILLLKEALETEINLQDICRQIDYYMSYSEKLQLFHYLFGIAHADDEFHESELKMLSQIASLLHISPADFESIFQIFQSSNQHFNNKSNYTVSINKQEQAYKILEIPETATNEEIKKAYRKLANLHHPDKVSHLGVEFQEAAKQKFQVLQEAYNTLKKTRNI